METSSRQGWQRYLHVSLRAFLILILLIGSWLGWITHSSRLQHDAVTALEEAGHWWWFEWEGKDGTPIRSAEP
jgi:hypothetical protein